MYSASVPQAEAQRDPTRLAHEVARHGEFIGEWGDTVD